jgi:phage gp36-like protein
LSLITASQYAQPGDLISYSLTAAAAARFTGEQQIAALKAASALADGYLNDRFKLPLAAWDLSLVMNVCHIASYLLYAQYGYVSGVKNEDTVNARYREALEWLVAIASKTLSPPFVDASASADPAGAFVLSEPRVGFTFMRHDEDC